MTKFGKQLRSSIRREWAGHYVNYKQLKATIKALKQLHAPPGGAEEGAVEQRFLEALLRELDRVHSFFAKTEGTLLAGWRVILADGISQVVERADEAQLQAVLAGPRGGAAENPAPAGDEALLRRFRDTYDDAQRLRQYVAINYVSFIKAVKKFEKKVGRAVSHLFLPRLQRSRFFNSPQLALLLAELERAAQQLLCATQPAATGGGSGDGDAAAVVAAVAAVAGQQPFSCALCQAPTREPVVLSCTHRFCWRCIASAEAVASSEGEWACPSCCWPQALSPAVYTLTSFSQVGQLSGASVERGVS
jgi:hypothetical protein